jgi:hypothetical protein
MPEAAVISARIIWGGTFSLWISRPAK